MVSNKEIIDTINLLKKDNKQNCRKTKKEGIMISWDIDRVKSLVDIYLDNVLKLLKIDEAKG